MLDLVLTLALLGAPDYTPPMPATAIEHMATVVPTARPQGYKDWWLALFMGKDRRRRNNPGPSNQQFPPPGGNTPATGPLPLVLLGMGVLGVGAAATSRRRKRKAAARALSSRARAKLGR